MTALLVLSACKHAPPPPPPPPTVEAPPLPRPKPKFHPKPPAPPAVPPAVLQAPVVTPIPPDIVLVGRSQADVKAALGEPTAQSERGAGQTWTYRGPRCTLDVVFFFDVSRNGFYALDKHLDGTDGTDADEQRCLSELHDEWAGK